MVVLFPYAGTDADEQELAMTTLPQTTNIQLPRPMGPTSMAPATHMGPGHMMLGQSQQSQLSGADIWRVIASCTSWGGVISRISTVVIFTPQRCVTSSILACKR